MSGEREGRGAEPARDVAPEGTPGGASAGSRADASRIPTAGSRRPAALARAHPLAALALGSLLLALLSLPLFPLGAGYDPLSWSIWGDELARGALDTRAGPAFKPLPVLLIAPVAGLFGEDAGLAWWLVLARAGGLLAAGAGGLLAARLTRALLTASAAVAGPGAGSSAIAHQGDPGEVDPGGVGPAVAATPGADPSTSAHANDRRDPGPAADRRPDRLVALAAVGAAVSILLCARFVKHALLGVSEPLVGLAAIAVLLEHRRGRFGRAWAWTMVAALLRPETWLVVGPYGLWLLWRRPRLRAVVVLSGLALPVLWFGAEQLGSGDWQRSQAIANVPNPGQPALSAFPFGVSLGGTLGIPPTPVLLAGLLAPVLSLRRRGLRTIRTWPAAERDLLATAGLGVGLVLLTAAMAELGYSGEGRYALPGLVLLMVAGAVVIARALAGVRPAALARGRRRALVATGVLAALLVAVRVPFVPLDAVKVHRQLESQRSLAGLVDRLGGPAAVRACGVAVSGRYREPVLARALGTPIAGVSKLVPPAGPTVVFAAPLDPGAPVTPSSRRALRPVATAAPWRVRAACRDGARLLARPTSAAADGPQPVSVWIP